MVRPRKCRRLSLKPAVRYYKPQGVPMRQIETVVLKDEELEALSLADYKGLDQEDAAQRMQISRSTFSRILSKARNAVATALVSGYALKIVSDENKK